MLSSGQQPFHFAGTADGTASAPAARCRTPVKSAPPGNTVRQAGSSVGKKPGFTPPWSRDANSVTAGTTMETVSPCTTRVNRIWGSSRGCSSFSAMRGAMRLTPKKDQQEHKGEFDPHLPDGLGEQTIGHAACPERPGIAGHGKDHAEYHHGRKDYAFQFCFWHMQLSSFSAKKNDTKYSETIRHGSQRYLMSFLLCGYSVIIIPRFFKFVKGESN